MKLSVVIPCYNEPDTIGEIVDRVFNVLLPGGWGREVIVVDDGSAETTKQALEASKRLHPELQIITRSHNGGKGAALKDGFKAVSGDYILIQDADLEYDPADIPKLLAPIASGTSLVVLGSRQIAQNNVSGRFYYYWGGRAVNIVFNLAFGTHLSDLTTCYKLFPKKLIPELLQQPSNDFVFDAVELSRVLSKEHIIEVPVHYHARDTAHGKKLSASDGIRCLRRILSLWVTKHSRIFRFIVVGGTAALVNVLVLYTLTNWFGVWYIASEIVAFIVALCYNFTLQKLWTFKSRTRAHVRQGFLFAVLNIVNLFLNTIVLYLLVQYAGLWYIVAQIIASFLIAIESFFLYRRIFR